MNNEGQHVFLTGQDKNGTDKVKVLKNVFFLLPQEIFLGSEVWFELFVFLHLFCVFLCQFV
jgi:hypothetical protein